MTSSDAVRALCSWDTPPMRFEVIVREGSPPDSAGGQQFTSTSPNKRWTLEISNSMEMRMGGARRGHGTLHGPDGSADLGQIGFPCSDFVPWLSEHLAVWMDRKGQPMLVPLAAPTKSRQLREIKGELISIACHANQGAALRMFGWRRRTLTFFNGSGEVTGEWQHHDLFGAVGFTGNGVAVVAMIQPEWKGPAELTAFDPSSGEVLVQTLLDEIDPFDPGPDRSAGSVGRASAQTCRFERGLRNLAT